MEDVPWELQDFLGAAAARTRPRATGGSVIQEEIRVFLGHGLPPAALLAGLAQGIPAYFQTHFHPLRLSRVCSHKHTSTITLFQGKKGGLKAGKGHEKPGEKEWAGKG